MTRIAPVSMPDKPMEVHLRDCVDSEPQGHKPNGLNYFCRCLCHASYSPKEGELHSFYQPVTDLRGEWVDVWGEAY